MLCLDQLWTSEVLQWTSTRLLHRALRGGDSFDRLRYGSPSRTPLPGKGAVDTMPNKHGNGWRARWVDEHGKRQSTTFRYRRDAELCERRKKGEIEEIVRGLRVGLPPDRTVGDLCDYWITNRVPQKRSGNHDESIIKCHLRPAFGDLLVRQFNVEHVDRFVVARAHLNRKTVANHLTLLGAMLNVARDLGWIAVVPRIRKPKVRPFSSDFRFLRTDDEIRRFLVAAREIGEAVYMLYATAVLTGMRAGELAGLEWSDVDFERRLITVQRSYDGPTKADDVRYIPILDALLPDLRAWRLVNGSRLVFPNEMGAMLGKSARVFQEVFKRVLKRAGFGTVEVDGKTRQYIRFHDLRHTFASHWVMKGGDLFKLQKILGHKTVQMTMRYAHLVPNAFAEDHARFVRVVVARTEVVQLAAHRAAP